MTGRSPVLARSDQVNPVFGLSPDGRYLATTHVPALALTVWDIDRGVPVVSDPGPGSIAARFSPDSRRLALVKRSRRVVVYNLATGGLSGRMGVTGVGKLALHPDGVRIAAIDDESNPPTCRIVEIETGLVLQTIVLRSHASDIAWSVDGSTLAIPGKDHKLDLWDAASGSLRNARRPYQRHCRRGLPSHRHAAS